MLHQSHTWCPFTLCAMVGRPRMLLPPSFMPWEWRSNTRRRNATVSTCVDVFALRNTERCERDQPQIYAQNRERQHQTEKTK